MLRRGHKGGRRPDTRPKPNGRVDGRYGSGDDPVLLEGPRVDVQEPEGMRRPTCSAAASVGHAGAPTSLDGPYAVGLMLSIGVPMVLVLPNGRGFIEVRRCPNTPRLLSRDGVRGGPCRLKGHVRGVIEVVRLTLAARSRVTRDRAPP